MICLDSGCGDYERMWSTTSLRGLVSGTLSVDNLTEGVHSGNAGGIVPSTFRIARALLSRIEDEASGQITPDALQAQIPEQRRRQAIGAAQALGDMVYSAFPWHGDSTPVQDDPVELILNRTWRAALEVTGAEGLPAIADAGSVRLVDGTTGLEIGGGLIEGGKRNRHDADRVPAGGLRPPRHSHSPR